ncbi:MAG: MBL fold metallo-hydrolase [Tannerella sp.]|jgi:phosphoribosyl 1,2-cyclic phosphodiesterase|nr:MBL fold metallo-hydrolase [Tannerella sp.]
MMTLKILGSSSRGNCYLLDNGREALAIEAGVPFAEVKRAVDFDISRIEGCIVSHEHQDHAKYIHAFLDARVNVAGSEGTIKSLEYPNYVSPFYLESNHVFQLGKFSILPFDVQHDAAEPYGFLIHHDEMGTTLFATDTFYLKNTFTGLNQIMIECNYRRDILDANTRSGKIPAAQRNRTLQSHLSYDTCLKTLLANDLSAVNNIVLIHLSDDNSNAAEFQAGIQTGTGKTVHVAGKGMRIDFNRTPF